MARLPGSVPGAWLLLGLLAGLPLAGSRAVAHDLWLRPSTFHPAVGELVEVELWLGAPGDREAVPRRGERFVRFTLADGAGERPVLGLEGGRPAGFLRPSRPGLQAVLYHGRAAVSELAAAPFEAYLAEEGLEAIVALRAERGERGAPGREAYSRALKALITVAGPVAGREIAGDRPHGLPLELVAATPPAAMAPGEPLTFRLLFHGEPLAGALVEAVPLVGSLRGPVASPGRTDVGGRVTFRLPRSGPWLLAVVHMVPASPVARRELGVDWESVWTALTFEAGRVGEEGGGG